MTGTRNVACFFGRDAEVASVGVGKIAGLVLLDANPLTDAANVRAADGAP